MAGFRRADCGPVRAATDSPEAVIGRSLEMPPIVNLVNLVNPVLSAPEAFPMGITQGLSPFPSTERPAEAGTPTGPRRMMTGR